MSDEDTKPIEIDGEYDEVETVVDEAEEPAQSRGRKPLAYLLIATTLVGAGYYYKDDISHLATGIIDRPQMMTSTDQLSLIHI